MDLILQFSTSEDFSSSIVRRLCHSPFSHVDVVVPGAGLLGASGAATYKNSAGATVHDEGGVRVRPFDPWIYKVKKEIRVKTDAAAAVVARAMTQVGKPFDDGALYSFLSSSPGERDWRDTASWFCSELVTWAEEVEGVFGWPLLVAKNRVSPADCLIINNPLIYPEDVADLRKMLETT